jgi:FMN-dependent NADH-azoreductase
MSLFRLDASIRADGSHSRQIADLVEEEWRAGHPGDLVITREVGLEPLPTTAWGDAVGAAFAGGEELTAAQRDAVALAGTLVDELAAADAYLLAVPLYNFGVSQHLKTWVDLVIADPRMAPGQRPVTAGKPAVLVTVRGGSYAAGTPREGWDHATGWMRRILADVWELDLEVVEAEFTLADVNPALAEFRDLAAELRAAADERAREHGRALGATRVA